MGLLLLRSRVGRPTFFCSKFYYLSDSTTVAGCDQGRSFATINQLTIAETATITTTPTQNFVFLLIKHSSYSKKVPHLEQYLDDDLHFVPQVEQVSLVVTVTGS